MQVVTLVILSKLMPFLCNVLPVVEGQSTHDVTTPWTDTFRFVRSRQTTDYLENFILETMHTQFERILRLYHDGQWPRFQQPLHLQQIMNDVNSRSSHLENWMSGSSHQLFQLQQQQDVVESMQRQLDSFSGQIAEITRQMASLQNEREATGREANKSTCCELLQHNFEVKYLIAEELLKLQMGEVNETFKGHDTQMSLLNKSLAEVESILSTQTRRIDAQQQAIQRFREQQADVTQELNRYWINITQQLKSMTDQKPGDRLLKSCLEIRTQNPSASSGLYSIITVSGKILKNVYCEMGLNGGGYTFVNPIDVPRLTSDEIQSMFTDRTNVLMRVRKADGTQPFAVLKQLPQYASYSVKIGVGENNGYTRPMNVDFLGAAYLFYGFIPADVARQRTTQGLQVNGVNVAFANGDANPNSYLALFPNFSERSPSTYSHSHSWDFYNRVVAQLARVPSGRVIPEELFLFLETHWGGGGCYMQTDGRQSAQGVLGAAIGFR